MSEHFYVNEDVNGIRVDVYELGPPRPDQHPDHYDAIGVDVETVDRYGRVVARIGLHLSPYKAKQLIEKINLALDAARHRQSEEAR